MSRTQYKYITKIVETENEYGCTTGVWYYITYQKTGATKKVYRLPQDAEYQIAKGVLKKYKYEYDSTKANGYYTTYFH